MNNEISDRNNRIFRIGDDSQLFKGELINMLIKFL
jgi:hypothetical protein